MSFPVTPSATAAAALPGDARRLAPPPLTVLAALTLWGWQVGALPWALAMGVTIEAARWARLRFDPGPEDFNRLWNLTTLLFLGVALYLFLAREGLGTVNSLLTTDAVSTRLEGLRRLSDTALAFLRALPFVLFPFVVAHAWSRTPALPWSTFSLLLRARAARELRHRAVAHTVAGLPRPSRSPVPHVPAFLPATPGVTDPHASRVHPGYPYLALVLFASCASTAHPVAYVPLLVALVSWALWPWRNRGYPLPAWIALFFLVLATTLATQYGLLRLRGVWQQLENRFLQRAAEGRLDQIRSQTALGSLGRIKLSGRIVLRVRTPDDRAPGLLREAAFQRFRGNVWTTAYRDFQPVIPVIEGLLWRLTPERHNGSRLDITRYTAQGEAPLALPADTLALRDLNAPTLETNLLGAARLRLGPPLAFYTVEHGPAGGFAAPPGLDDLDLEHLAEPDRSLIRAVALELGLPSQSPQQALQTVARHFAAHFSYSLWQRDRPRTRTDPPSALATFLRHARTGHCEYFATATVLLLRAAGIPTRYAVGYSLTQKRGDDWIARRRDAHAWCLAYLDGRWLDVDTTPAGWRDREQANAAWGETVGDFFSDAWYRFARWRQQGGNWRLYVFALSMAVLAWLGWRQIRGSSWQRARTSRTPSAARPVPAGLDSEFYALARSAETLHGPRLTHETWRAWIRRSGLAATPQAPRFTEALHLHERLRFDPAGLTPAERQRLRQLASR